ncbi:tRNA epoxyqueuosine(34) reductase QueG [Pontibacter sp. G13]|uniref:tRNA epoxyqueuosine(34) reductase QueG n=1 Tax=Pontibacter sp. G13 TaxID=3074898 RepID=UPI00288B2575|nr:tRNA epoxyqueuosine(34) reductase QueG [Pontibacter sp. G13]WNJ19463.1 tRNA epoxyqueuosine(34) reductase QueG [Pontibacter sp. G13]
MDKQAITAKIKARATEMGFDLVGISEATFLEPEARDLEQFLTEERHGKMDWLANHFDKRVDPRLLVEGAKSVISVIHNYLPQPQDHQPDDAPKVSRYAWGEDYHKVLKRKLYELFRDIHAWMGTEIPGRVFVDSAPVMDKAWAKRSGLGWIGKHTNLISPHKGSWFFIGEIILDLELEYDGPIKDYCGTCTRCIDACPTDALAPYQIDSNKCISYLTIELREDIPEAFAGKMDGWAYGCDICQEVCPWNRFSIPHEGGEFAPLQLAGYTRGDWEEITEKTFKKLTKKTAMNRVKWDKMKGNLKFLGFSPDDSA